MKKVYVYAVMFLLSTLTFAASENGVIETSVEKTTVKVVNPNDYDFSCDKFGKGEDSLKSVQWYSLYREFFKQKNYDEAMKYWPFVYKVAPTLNSRVISNGISYYGDLLKAEKEDGPRKDELLDSLIMLNYHKMHCYKKGLASETKIKSKIGWYYQTYRPEATDEIKRIYGDVIHTAKNDAPYYTLDPYFRFLLIDLDKGLVTPEEVLAEKEMIEGIIEANSTDEKYGAKFLKVGESITSLFENNKKVGDLFDCEAMKPTWFEQYPAHKQDIVWIRDMYRKMHTKKCQYDPFTLSLREDIFRLDPQPSDYMKKANVEMRAKNYSAAIPWMEKAISLTTDQAKKIEWTYSIANLKYIMKDFSGSRAMAKQVIEMRPDWGKPYILIGKLYASSGKLCGPGTGLESQKVIWPALDYFQKAKRIDASFADEAQKLINKYWQYLPTKEDLFMIGITDGKSYYVGCWIKENTTVRTK